jgi:hypothetical protein
LSFFDSVVVVRVQEGAYLHLRGTTPAPQLQTIARTHLQPNRGRVAVIDTTMSKRSTEVPWMVALALGVGTAAGALTSVLLWRRVAALQKELQDARRKKGDGLLEKSRGITLGGPFTKGGDEQTAGGEDPSSEVEAFGQGEEMDAATFAQQMLSQKNELLNLLQDVSSSVGTWETQHRALQDRLHKDS